MTQWRQQSHRIRTKAVTTVYYYDFNNFINIISKLLILYDYLVLVLVLVFFYDNIENLRS